MLSDDTNNIRAAHNIEDISIEKGFVIGLKDFFPAGLTIRRRYPILGYRRGERKTKTDLKGYRTMSAEQSLAEKIIGEMYDRYVRDGIKLPDVNEADNDDEISDEEVANGEIYESDNMPYCEEYQADNEYWGN
jgi:hypothetical protein